MTEEQKKKKTMKPRRCCKSSRHLPEEMILEILSRLSAKSLCRFRCVSRLWRSMIQSPVVVSAHHARSSANPKLLLCLDNDVNGEGHVFSTAYPISIPSLENKVEDASSCWCSHGQTGTTGDVFASEAGLICSYDLDRKEIHVANPITGERISSRTLLRQFDCDTTTHTVCFGYDPVENKHKVLVVWWDLEPRKWDLVFGKAILTVDIFTVGGAEAWRRIIKPSGLPDILYFSRLKDKSMRMRSICIDGTIYITGVDKESKSWLVSFDVRTETFRAIPVPAEASFGTSFCLLGLGGAPAFIEEPEKPNRLMYKGNMINFRLWILDDFCRQLWSFREFLVPPSSSSYPVQLTGTTSRGEIILSNMFPPDILYIYRLENSTIKAVEIPQYRLKPGLYPCDLTAFYHIENLQPLRNPVPNTTTRLSRLGT